MAERPEIPEAKDPFEKRAALTISIIAICLTFIGNLGDSAKTEAIIKTNEASDQWGYYQAKGIKGQMASMHASLLTSLSGAGITESIKAETAKLAKEAERYEADKVEIKAKAEELTKEAAHKSVINDRCDHSSLFLQVSVVFCSVAILSRSHKLWLGGVLLGAIGIVVGVTAFLL